MWRSRCQYITTYPFFFLFFHGRAEEGQCFWISSHKWHFLSKPALTECRPSMAAATRGTSCALIAPAAASKVRYSVHVQGWKSQVRRWPVKEWSERAQRITKPHVPRDAYILFSVGLSRGAFLSYAVLRVLKVTRTRSRENGKARVRH